VSANYHQAAGTVVQTSSEHNADDPGTIGEGCGTKRRVDCRTMMIFPRAANQPEVMSFDDHMPIGRCDIDGAILDLLPITWVDGVQAAGAV
jgi:hypothetical protein